MMLSSIKVVAIIHVTITRLKSKKISSTQLRNMIAIVLLSQKAIIVLESNVIQLVSSVVLFT